MKMIAALVMLMSINCFADTYVIEFSNCSNGLPLCAKPYYNITTDTLHHANLIVAEVDPALSAADKAEINKKRNRLMMPHENGLSFPLKVNGKMKRTGRYYTLYMSEVLKD